MGLPQGDVFQATIHNENDCLSLNCVEREATHWFIK